MQASVFEIGSNSSMPKTMWTSAPWLWKAFCHILNHLTNCHGYIIKWLRNYIFKFIIFCHSSFLAFRRHCIFDDTWECTTLIFGDLIWSPLSTSMFSKETLGYYYINLINSVWYSIPSTFLLCNFNTITFYYILSPKLCHLRVVRHRYCHPLLGSKFSLLQTKKNGNTTNI